MFWKKKRRDSVKPNLIYKYRGGDDEIFERDLSSIERNYFWASPIKELNDPCEGFVTKNKLNYQVNSLGQISEKELERVLHSTENLISNKNIGIYSLSKVYDDELLWAHYANSHKGFCIEYDLDVLLKSYNKDRIFPFSMTYNDEPYDISVNDIANKSNEWIQKIAGYKSKRWEYEREYRMVTDFFGIHSYNFRAVKSIYFGLRMRQENKEELMRRLQGRGIKYYQMNLTSKSYNFFIEEVLDPYESGLIYLNYIPESITGNKRIGCKIREKDYLRFRKRGTISLEIESAISMSQLNEFAKFIKDHVFSEAERVFMFHYIKNEEDYGVAWATSHFEKGEIKVNINEFT
ncbi:DUF2971 domain-containing protein [Aquimarina algiphila]|uniref:DUF2971 domain-containing protein n=1 Tax=Aquimarina algiphila TaxID=2047982 RepID=UPI00232FF1A3|nr:DUF2971 domain-containing protein [Aquimarina algiphila]